MSTEKEIHVNPVGENWEVEDQSETLAQAETREEAIAAAKELATQKHARKILIHTSDGMVEREIPVEKTGMD